MSTTIKTQEAVSPWSGVVSTGLALFSMYFGAGNLIFPLIVGKMVGTESPAAVVGLGVSAVLFPLLGLIAMMMFGADLRSFLGRLGRLPAFALLFVLLLTQGPVASMPRLVTLMHTSFTQFFPHFSLPLFSVLICGVVLAFVHFRTRLIDLLGMILTPILLVTLALLIFFGWYSAPSSAYTGVTTMESFLAGLKGGYQTTDLIASLLFATVIMPHLSRGVTSSEMARTRMIGASLIASGLLMITYIGLTYLAAHHGPSLAPNLAPQELLHALAARVLGPWGALVASGAVFFACFTTAVSLALICSDMIRTELLGSRVSPFMAQVITISTMAILANLGFTGIMHLAGPILEAIYPALIVLCLANIAHKLYGTTVVKTPFWIVLGLSAIGLIVG